MRYIVGSTYSPKKRFIVRVLGYTLSLFIIFPMIGAVLLIRSKEIAFESAAQIGVIPPAQSETKDQNSFPVTVDPIKKEILEDPAAEILIEREVFSEAPHKRTRITWFTRVLSKLALFSWYQNLASPMSKILVIEEGERKEQVVDNFGDILRWDTTERKAFSSYIESTAPALTEGKFFPANYVVGKDATPEDVAKQLLDRFQNEVVARYTDDVAARVPFDDALTIASLLEREAYDFEDMRHISGVIWNRLFDDMNLQIDATLQYAKGSDPNQPWWPRVRPQDKYIKSPFNTYQNAGLPPAPIANPSVEAIIAALNPKKTSCIYYFHDKDGGFHCTPTYEEHVTLLKEYYGRGK